MARTVRFHETGGPEVLRLEDVEPERPRSGEVQLRVEAIGLNRAEALFRRGEYIEPVKRFPGTLGAEAAGVIEAIGPGVSGFTVGQPVSVVPAFSQNDYGMYAERAIAPASALVPRPDGMDAISGAAVWMPYLTTYGAMVDAGPLRAGDAVVINAASSSVGIAAVHTANRIGATPIAVTRTRAKRQRLIDEGADHVIVSGDEDVAEHVLAITGGRGAERILDAVAGPGVTDLARAVAPGGTLLLWGSQSGRPTPYPGFDLGMPALNVRTYTLHEITRDPDRMRRAAAYITSGLRTGAFRPVIDRVFGLEQIVQAHLHMESNAQFGKIVVTVS